TNVFNPQTASFSFKKGPVFSQFVLIDEINRAPAKTQAALFEVMEERQVTMDGVLHPMGDPFMVIATQNPIEHEGTYRLPEAQLDRFMVKIIVGYPSPEEEVTILQNQNQTALTEQLDQLQTILSAGQLKSAKQKVTQVKVEHKLLEFIAQITSQTRQDLSLYVGASPRASLALLQLSKALAKIGRAHV